MQWSSDDAVVDAFSSLRRGRMGDERAPHKPLLLLMALAQLQRGGERWLLYEDVHRQLASLLRDYGPQRARQHPEMPFWRLQNDGLWEIPQADLIGDDLTIGGDAKVAVLKRVDATGGFPQPLYDRLSQQPDLVNRLTTVLLEQTLPPSLHEDLLNAVGMPWVSVAARKRDPGFRERILDIYDRRCAVCGYDGRLGSSDLAIEAAHVRWHAYDGPDAMDNGLALCTFHHKALDRGAIGLTEAHEVMVSEKVSGQTMLEELLYRHAGQPFREPKPGRPLPALGHIRWHRKQVFQDPPRGGASDA